MSSKDNSYQILVHLITKILTRLDILEATIMANINDFNTSLSTLESTIQDFGQKFADGLQTLETELKSQNAASSDVDLTPQINRVNAINNQVGNFVSQLQTAIASNAPASSSTPAATTTSTTTTTAPDATGATVVPGSSDTSATPSA